MIAVSVPDGRPFSVAYGGPEAGLATTLADLERLRGATSHRTVRPATWDDLVQGAARPCADIVVIGCDAGRAAMLPSDRSLVLPYRVRLVVDVAGPVEVRVSKRARKEFAHRMRQRGWSWMQDRTSAGFDFFYDRMHRPTMRRRHGEHARSEPRDVAYQSLFRKGYLFFVCERGHRVAGALCGWDARTRTATLRLVGVLDGDDSHYASGAFKAVYHLLMTWAAGGAVERVDLSVSSPFLGLGVVQWKRRFHPRVELPPARLGDLRLWFHAARDTDAVRDFLAANPLIAVTVDGDLEARGFHDRRRRLRSELCSGMAGVRPPRPVDLDELFASR